MASLSFTPAEKPVERPLPMKLAALVLDRPTPSFAGVLTRNAFVGAPVILARRLLDFDHSRGVLVNTKIANVGAPGGLEDALSVQAAFARALGAEADQIFVLSTGIIGWRLPVAAIAASLPEVVSRLGADGPVELAEAIMTTDSYPKLRCVPLGGGHLCGVVKGAGMIEPNLGTMIGLIFTDVSVDRKTLRHALADASAESFNRISVDGDQSTSDAVLAFSSNVLPPVSEQEFREALTPLCRELAQDVVRNGEGTAHVLEVVVRGAPDVRTAEEVGRHIVNSPLVKTAVYGNDPNVGRILAAAGSRLGRLHPGADLGRLRLSIGGLTVYRDGGFRLDTATEARLSAYLRDCALPEVRDYPPHERNVLIELDLGLGGGEARLLGSDLSHEYIRVNADYRS